MRKQQIIILGIVFGISLLGLIILQTSYFQTAYEVKKEQFFYSANRAMDDMVDYIRKQEEAGRLSENGNLTEVKNRGVEIDAPIYIDPKRPVAVKNDPSAVANSMLNLIDDDSEVRDVSEFMGSKFKEDNLATSISKLQQAMKERTGENYRFVPEGKEDKHVIEGRVNLNNLYGFIGNTLTDAGIRSRFEFGIKENGKFILSSKNFLSHMSDDVTLSRKIFPGESSSAILYLKFPDASSDTAGSVWMVLPGVLITIAIVFCAVFCLIVIVRQKKLSVIKNDFINNMTHEFKTPLATISLATSAIEKEKVLNDRTQILKFNSMIRNENERMNKYVERILLQAKLDRREVHLKKVPVNLNVLVDEAVEHFRLQVEEKGGVIRAELDPEGYVMSADEVHMLNVVCNLIDNAIKYSHDSLNIYIYTKQEGNRFIIGVRDTGIGIPKEAQDKVFKRFYRVPSGNLHNVKGFGLGLSYAKSIVELHGGEIQLTSKKNKGTLVEIIFKMES